MQAAKPGYAKLSQSIPVVGIWDDHDYGGNDSDESYEWKQESKQLFLDFLGTPFDNPVRLHNGVYSSYLLGEGADRVNLILLDLRWWRNAEDLLGDEQWAWLGQQLGVITNQRYDNNNGISTAPAPVMNILVTSIQLVVHDPVRIGFDRFGHWKHAKERLYAMIEASPVPTVVISGDVHSAEISRDCNIIKRWGGLLDITTSGLTQTRPHWTGQAVCNPQRISGQSFELNWAAATFDWLARTATFAIHDKDGGVIYSETVNFDTTTTAACRTGQGAHLVCGLAYVISLIVAIVLVSVGVCCVCPCLVLRDSRRRKISFWATCIDWARAPDRVIRRWRGLPPIKRPQSQSEA